MAASRFGHSFKNFLCDTCRQRLSGNLLRQRRALGTTPSRQADSGHNATTSNSRTHNASFPRSTPRMSNRAMASSSISEISRVLDGPGDLSILGEGPVQPHRLHVYATKHNTHITFVQPPKSAAQTASSSISSTTGSASQQNKTVDVLLSISTGNIGFKKAGRGSYDAAYQLAAYALKTMKEKGMLQGCDNMEVVLRGFGAGREAVTKAILGTEGRDIRTRIRKVVDATRLKQGGPRSPKPRRLG